MVYKNVSLLLTLNFEQSLFVAVIWLQPNVHSQMAVILKKARTLSIYYYVVLLFNLVLALYHVE